MFVFVSVGERQASDERQLVAISPPGALHGVFFFQAEGLRRCRRLDFLLPLTREEAKGTRGGMVRGLASIDGRLSRGGIRRGRGGLRRWILLVLVRTGF